MPIDAANNWKEGEDIATSAGMSAYSGGSLTVDSDMSSGSWKRQVKKLKQVHLDGAKCSSVAAEVAHMLAYSSKCASFCDKFV